LQIRARQPTVGDSNGACRSLDNDGFDYGESRANGIWHKRAVFPNVEMKPHHPM
jgi:hypothetical protein